MANIKFDELCGVAIARFGLSVDAFYDLTPSEFKHALIIKDEEELSNFKIQYEVARFTVKHLWNISGKTLKNWINDAREIEKFSWDTEEIITRQQTVEEMKETVLGIAKSFAHLKPSKQKT